MCTCLANKADSDSVTKLILNGKLKEMKKYMELHMTGVSSLTVISNLPEIIIIDLTIIPGGTF